MCKIVWVVLLSSLVFSENARNDEESCEKFCPKEVVMGLTFPKTEAGCTAMPVEFCLGANYMPPLRFCQRNATWSKVAGNCAQQTSEEAIENIFPTFATPLTLDLYNLSKTNSSNVVSALNKIVKNNSQALTTIDLHFVATTFNNAVVDSNSNYFAAFEMVNNLMSINREVLNHSQLTLNSTDAILYGIDKTLLGMNISLNSHFSSFIVKSAEFVDSTVGVLFYNQTIILLNSKNYSRILELDEFDVAFIAGSQNYGRSFLTLFSNDALFNHPSSDIVNSRVVNVLLPNSPSNETIELYFKVNKDLEVDHECAFWEYGRGNDSLPIRGRWTRGFLAIPHKKRVYKCAFNHTTHFALLISSDVDPDSVFMSVITIFGSALSLMGIGAIFLTACMFKQWRNKASHKIILNVVSCMLLIIILFFTSDAVPEGPACITVGFLLHYAILAHFFWTMVISYSNYRRFIKEVHYQIENQILKYCLFSWLCPFFIVVVVLIINPSTYQKTDDQYSICYPKEPFLKLTLIVPISVMLAINFIIYIVIIVKLIKTRLDIRKHILSKSYSVEKSIILMFFLMGLLWIFGLLGALTDYPVFSYLFCIALALYGFILFVCYVLDSSATRKLWNLKMKNVKNSLSENGSSVKSHSRDAITENKSSG